MNRPAVTLLCFLSVSVSIAQAQTILIGNGNFENPSINGFSTSSPDDWGYYASGPNGGSAPKNNGVTDTIAQSGSQSLWFTSDSVDQGAGYEAHYLKGADSFTDFTPLSLNTGSNVQLSFWIRSDAVTPFSGDAVARFALEFHDNTQVGNPNVGATGSWLSLHFANDGFSTTSWVQVTLSASPNAFSNNILFVADYQNFPSGSYAFSEGTFYVDNITAMVVPEPGSALLAGLGLCIGTVAIRRRDRRQTIR